MVSEPSKIILLLSCSLPCALHAPCLNCERPDTLMHDMVISRHPVLFAGEASLNRWSEPTSIPRQPSRRADAVVWLKYQAKKAPVIYCMFHCFFFPLPSARCNYTSRCCHRPSSKEHVLQSNKRIKTARHTAGAGTNEASLVDTEREWLRPGGSLAELELECKLKPRKSLRAAARVASPSSGRGHNEDNELPSLPSRAGCWLGPTG